MDRMLVAFVLTLLFGTIHGFLAESLSNALGLDNSEEILRVYNDLMQKMNDPRREESRQGFGPIPDGETAVATFVAGPGFTSAPVNLEIGNTTIVDSSAFNNTLPLDIVIGDVFIDFITVMIVLKIFGITENQVIFIQWTTGFDADALYYPENARRVSETADFVSDILRTIDASSKPLDMSLTRIITSGLGSHVAGLVGQNFPGLKEITASNPTAKSFKKAPAGQKLDKTDAEYVKVYHTSSSIGIREPIGDIDYYLIVGDSYEEGQYASLHKFNFCNHKLGAYVYFISTIENLFLGPGILQAYECTSAGRFKSGLCNNNEAVPLGHHADTTQTGTYYAQLESYRTNTSLEISFGNNKYCDVFPEPMQAVTVTFWTQTGRNRGYIMAQSLVNNNSNPISEYLPEYHYESNFKQILNHRSGSPGFVLSALQVPVLAPMEDVQYVLLYRNKVRYSGNFTIDRIVFSWKNGTVENHVSACDITLAPFVDYPPLDLFPGENCGGPQ